MSGQKGKGRNKRLAIDELTANDVSSESDEEVDVGVMSTEDLCRRFLPILPKLQKKVDKALKKLSDQRLEIDNLKEQVVKLEDEVDTLKSENSRLHHQANQHNLVLSGLDEVRGETTFTLHRRIEELLKTKLKRDFRIDTAFRLGKPEETKPRLVKIRFELMRERNYVWDNRKSMGHPLCKRRLAPQSESKQSNFAQRS